MSSHYEPYFEDFCGMCSASADACELIEAANQNWTFVVHAAPIELRVEAANALRSCRRLGCPAHASWQEHVQLLEERTCGKCRVWMDGDSLCDAAELSPLDGDVCESCFDQLEEASQARLEPAEIALASEPTVRTVYSCEQLEANRPFEALR